MRPADEDRIQRPQPRHYVNRSRRGRLVAALAFWGLAACAPAGSEPSWHEEPGYRWLELAVPQGSPGFTRMEGRSGIRFQNMVSDSVLLRNRILAQGAGVALGDVDGDGRVDVFLARTEGPNALYRNLGGWRFDDITERAGVAAPGRYSTGAAFADLDGDGDLDLLLLSTTGPNAVFINDGTGVFTERLDLGLDSSPKGATTPALADVDGDGDLDLYVSNYKATSIVDSIPPQSRAFDQVVRQVAPGRFEIAPAFAPHFKLVTPPGLGGVYLSIRAEPDDFYRNDGGRFVREPLTAGRFRDASGAVIAIPAESFGLTARFADLNGDGAPDLYVANDFEDPDQFWINDGAGGFRMADWTAQRQTSNSGMGVDVGDVDGDGLPDLFEVDMLSNDSRRLKTQMPTHTARPKQPGDVQTQLHLQRNTLFLNRGDGTFGEISAFAGVQATGWSWSTMLLDVDLDGWQDILVANGHTWDVMDADTQERLQNRLSGVGWQRERWEYPPLPLRNVAYRNRGDRTFEDATVAWRFGLEEDISHAFAAADLDGDGDLDVVVNRLGSPALVLRNDSPAPRVAVRLIGDPPNTHAIGAKIRLLGGAVPFQEREVAAGGLYLSHSDYQATFAAGGADSMTLVVDWRDGRRTVLDGVRPNRLYHITAATATGHVPADSLGFQPGPTLFEDRSAELGGHAHHEAAFDDWERQFLLPNALSQLGPGVAWVDLDGDGDEDLVVGAGRGGRLGVFMNEAGVLRRAPAPGPEAPLDLTAIVGLAQAGGVRILAGLSTWEAPGRSADLPAVLSIAAGHAGLGAATPAVPPHPHATGPLALADLDGDGDLDLFVGRRVVPAQYPRPASSAVFRNDGGAFVEDSTHAATLRDVGLVSAALFADVDSDGDPDLLLAREWGSILLLLNGGGRLTPASDRWGLSRWTSRWNGLAAGDLNGDGRLDLVATSWGRNTATPADSARPLVMFHGPFGAGGEEEMVLARDDPRLGGLAPLNSFARMRVALPDLVGRVRNFAAYADATVDQVLGPHRGQVRRVEAVTLDHMVFLNRGDRFEAVPLPAEAQFAPAFYAGIADFDGDGSEDLVLSQNFFPTAVGIPRYDAGRGLLLLGDGAGGLTPVPGSRSGLLVYGDQRGAAYADFDGDGRLDLALSQNASAAHLLRNRLAQPGLRVRLRGSGANPDAVGAQVRLVYGGRMGPVREVHAGSGYWSQNGAVQVFGLAGAPTAVWVRWPGGAETMAPVPTGAREVVVAR